MAQEYLSKKEAKERKRFSPKRKRKIKKAFLITSGILVLAALIWGLGQVLPNQPSSAIVATR